MYSLLDKKQVNSLLRENFIHRVQQNHASGSQIHNAEAAFISGWPLFQGGLNSGVVLILNL